MRRKVPSDWAGNSQSPGGCARRWSPPPDRGSIKGETSITSADCVTKLSTEPDQAQGILDAIKLGALDLARALSERLAKRHPSLLASAFDQVTEATERRGRG